MDGNNAFTAIAQDAYGGSDSNSIVVNLPLSATFQYDLNGNMTNDGTHVLDYDDENQLVTNTVAGSWKSEFVYDGKLRRRIRREYSWQGGTWVKTNEVRYVYDGNLVLQERDSNNSGTMTYTRGLDLSGSLQRAGGIGGLLALSQPPTVNSQPAYYHADGNGNVTALVNQRQEIVARYLYDPFGNTLSAAGPMAEVNPYRFCSKEAHANSGLIYYLYRYYDCANHRWLNRDPIAERGGLNNYNYLNNSPISKVDAFGLSGDDVILIMDAAGAYTAKMTSEGVRSGNGVWGSVWNNIRVTPWSKRVGCASQTDRLLANALLPLDDLDDSWTFAHVETIFPYTHQYIIAHSDNPEDPTLIIAPNHNEIKKLSQPTPTAHVLIGAEIYKISNTGTKTSATITFGSLLKFYTGGPPPTVIYR